MVDKRKTAIVIGDVMLDRCVIGTVTRMSPEAPVPVLCPQSMTETPGGAANTARNLAAMGVRTQLVGVVGNDAPGHRLYELLTAAEGVSPCMLLGEGATTAKTRFSAGDYQILRVDDDGPPQIRPELVWQAFHQALQARDDVGIVIIVDYAKGALLDLRSALVQVCRQHRIPVYVDAKPEHYPEYAGATLLKPNLSEAMKLCHIAGIVHPGLYTVEVPSKAETAAMELRKQLKAESVVVTADVYGAGWADAQTSSFVATKPVRFADVAGAGDTFMAALAASKLGGYDLRASVQRAIAAGSLVVAKQGPSIVTEAELEEASYETGKPQSKYMSFVQAAAFVRRRQALGQSVGFVNGCFDCLHAGHVQMLTWARERCGALVIALDSDESVRELKGPDRPIMPADVRAKMLEPFADALVCFHTSQLEELIRMIKPDSLVKGDEYKSRNLPGADFVANRGGLVLFAPMLPGVSTTALVEAMRGKPTV